MGLRDRFRREPNTVGGRLRDVTGRVFNVLMLAVSIGLLVVSIREHDWWLVGAWVVCIVYNFLMVAGEFKRLWFGEKRPIVQTVRFRKKWWQWWWWF